MNHEHFYDHILMCLFYIIYFPVTFFRFFAICYPMKVKTICTNQRAKLVIPVLWIAGFIAGIPRGINTA